jgi:hypothetical protein
MTGTEGTSDKGKGQRAGGRSPLLAAVLSGLFPGLGQFYNRQRGKGLLFLVGGALTAFGPLNPLTVDIDPGDLAAGMEKVLLASLPFLLVALWSVIDAWRVARAGQQPN